MRGPQVNRVTRNASLSSGSFVYVYLDDEFELVAVGHEEKNRSYALGFLPPALPGTPGTPAKRAYDVV